MVARRFLHALVAASMVAGAGLTAAKAASPAGLPTGGAPPIQAAEGAAPGSAARAVADARALGRAVPVESQRTETREVVANPDGTFTAELTAAPTRVRRGTGWTTVDTTLARRSDGAVAPKAVTVDLLLSGGGTQPLVRYGRGDQQVVLSWPRPLPKPTLSDGTATYPEVMPGIDLQIRAEAAGYSQFLVVKNAAAARNQALDAVRFGLRGEGLKISARPGGALSAVDAKGGVVFAAGQSEMWDASGRRAVAAVSVDSGSLTVRPDRTMLDDPATVYPVTVDPIWHPAAKQAWTSVLSGKPTSEFWNSSGDPPRAQVGYCYPVAACNNIDTAWSYFKFDTSVLAPAGRIVMEAWLDLTVVHSPDCSPTNQEHELYKARTTITEATNWNTRPSGDYLGRFVPPKVNATYGCGGWKGVALNVVNSVNRGGTTTWLIKARSDTDGLAWRKYESGETKLRIRYNDVPAAPTDIRTDPPIAAPCTWCAGLRYVGDEGIYLKARLTDPNADSVKPLWRFDVNGSVTDRWGAPKISGELHDTYLDLKSRNNKTIDWNVKADDGAHGGAWTHGVGPFVVDRDAPSQEPTVSAKLYQEDNRWHGGVGVPDTFTFDTGAYRDPNGVADIDHFLYGWNDAPTTKVVADKLGGKASVQLSPPGDGPQDLYVRMVDRAGHRGPVKVHHFYVRAGNGPLAQWSYDGNAKDEAYLGEAHGTLVGDASYVPGAVGSAVEFKHGGHVTAPNTLRTATSFSVSAWVRLTTVSNTHVAASQAGQVGSAFQLGYRSGKWWFAMKQADAVGATDVAAQSAEPAAVGTWTHLTGVYDAPKNQLRLYVDGVLAGSVTYTGAWDSTGLFRVGNALNSEVLNNHWLGLVDEVKAYDRILSAAEIRAAVGDSNVQVGHWQLDDASGTTARNSVAGGQMGTLSEGASFTAPADGSIGGAVQLDGTHGNVSTSGPVFRTDQSFSVAAWVKLDRRPSAGNSFTVLSQDGEQVSGFFLGYREDSGGRWEFYAPGADSQTPGGTALRSAATAQVGKWTHLAAVYDSSTRQLQLYVDGDPADPVTHTGGFNATGPFRIGQGLIQGGPTNRWPGAVDEARAYSREISAAEVRGIVARGNVTVGNWKLDGDATDSSGNVHHGTAGGGVEWVGGQSGVPDPTDKAIRLDGTSGAVATGQVVDTTQSFSVSAWVRVDGTGGTAAAVSQDGANTSGFTLQASPDGHWMFGMPRTDTATAIVDAVKSAGAAQIGRWTHLVGVYSKERERIELYVNGLHAGSVAHTEGFASTGEFRIGRGRTGQWFPGSIDDVAVHGRMLFAEEIRTMAGRDLTLAHNHRLDEADGTIAADAVGSRTATITGGVTHVPGKVGNALHFDGSTGAATTTGVDLRTDSSFTVAAWVYLDRTCDPGADFACRMTAVGVDGGQASKFRLGHVVDQDNNALGAWTFEMPESDTAGAPVTKAAVSTEPSDVGRWVHLVGVYDQETSKTWLYVNGTRIGDGTLNTAWDATGGLALGRGKAAGVPAQYWAGSVDDTRLYTGTLDQDQIAKLYRS